MTFLTGLTRRHVLVIGSAAAAAGVIRAPFARAAEGEVHGISAFGDLKYPAGFKQFDYVNVDAPKGGLFSSIPWARAYNQSFLTFNSLNAFILKGDGAVGMEQTFTTLMARAGDEPDAPPPSSGPPEPPSNPS